MRKSLVLIAGLCLVFPAHAASKSERNRRKAEKDYAAAIDSIRAGDFARAKNLLDEAVVLDRNNIQVLTAQELLRQNDVRQKIRQATQDLASNQCEQANAQFRAALAIDPNNAVAQQGLHSALAGTSTSEPRIRYRDADDIYLEPKNAPHDFHYKGDTRGLLDAVWNAYGIRPLIDNSVTSKQQRFDIDGASFATAVTIASQMTDTFYVPVAENQALIFADTPENRRNFERLAMRTFYIGDASSPQDINDAVTLLHTIFDIRFVTAAPSSNQVTVRAPMAMLDAATRILEDLYSGKPQVMLEVNV